MAACLSKGHTEICKYSAADACLDKGDNVNKTFFIQCNQAYQDVQLGMTIDIGHVVIGQGMLSLLQT